MKRIVFGGPGALSVDDVESVRIEEPTDALVRVSLAGIGATDVRAFTGERPRQPGTSLGSEFTGEVVETGERVSRVRRGQRVISPFSTYCGGCFYCKQGLLTACENYRAFGRELPGAQAEYVRVPNADAMLEAVPDNVGDAQALLAAGLLSGVLAGLRSAELQAGESVVVLGCGPTGLSALLLARTMGAGRLVAVDHHDYRLAVATELGAEAIDFERASVSQRVLDVTNGRGADLVVEAVGRLESLVQAVALVRPWGRVLSLGDDMADEATFPIGALLRKQARLIPAALPPVKNHMTSVLQMLSRGVFDPTPLLSHTLPLAEAQRGYELMAGRQDGALKVALRP